jgi:uncharacterized membrane protein (UPF0127 family)
MKISLLILGILIVFILIFIKIDYLNPKLPTTEINGHVFSLYLAKTSQEQEEGLAKFNKIDKNQGMLFIFQKQDYHSFWMKNMQFPIDIIFINKNKIVDIFQKVPVAVGENLPTYTTKAKADKVLEINSGLSNEYKIKIGDNVEINL